VKKTRAFDEPTDKCRTGIEKQFDIN